MIFSVGGSGGHLFPAQTLAGDLLESDPSIEVRFVGVRLSQSPYFQKDRFIYKELSGESPFGKGFWRSIPSLFSLGRGFMQAMNLLASFSPDLVVGFGSFHSFPLLMAAKLWHIPILLFESNVFPGRVNRLFSRWARLSAIQFLPAADHLRGSSVLVKMPLPFRSLGECSRTAARARYHLDEERLTFLLFGGSQGAQLVNEHASLALCRLALISDIHFQLLHLTGKDEEVDKFQKIYRKYRLPAHVQSFEPRMEFAWSAADIAISRAGSATLSERLFFEVPGVLIPYPYGAENHQEINADFFVNVLKGGIKVREEDLKRGQLANILRDFLASTSQLKRMGENLRNHHRLGRGKPLSAVVRDLLWN